MFFLSFVFVHVHVSVCTCTCMGILFVCDCSLEVMGFHVCVLSIHDLMEVDYWVGVDTNLDLH